MDYLEKKGHLPVKHLTGGRLTYLCPLPWHTETKPSFVVWTNASYENFYCFGCLAKHNIIHLVSFLEGISGRKAIEKLAEGLEFSIVDEEKILQADIMTRSHVVEVKEPNVVDSLAKSLVEISNICNTFLESVDYDEEECTRFDKLWAVIDMSLRDFDFEKIEKMRKEIGGVVLRRKQVLAEKSVSEMRKIYSREVE